MNDLQPWATEARAARLRDVERRLNQHPAALEYRECEALARTVTGVFLPNATELCALLDAAATNQQLAVELVQNVRAPVVRERFQATVGQRLHNYLASTTTLVDHVRRIMNGRSGHLVDEFAAKKRDVVAHPEIGFMVGLRNFTLHRVLPFVGHTLTITDANTPEASMVSEVQLSVAELLEWTGWTADAAAFVSSHGEALQLRAVVRSHVNLVAPLNLWLHDELMGLIDIAAVNELVVERNAILAGTDMETARRITQEWTDRRARPDPTATPQ